MRKTKLEFKSPKAITLMALVITIIVLLILAGVSVVLLTGEMGIINQSIRAKEQSEIAEEIEMIKLAIMQAIGQDEYRKLTKNKFEEELSKLLNNDQKVYSLEDKYITQMEKSQRIYSITNDGKVIEISDLETFLLAKYMEEIKNAYEEAKVDSNNNAEMFQKVQELLNYEGTNYVASTGSMVIETVDGYKFTLTQDGNVIQGFFAYLNIADGAIDLYKTGYKQNNGELVNYEGNYVITGTSTTNIVRVMDEGTYNITIKELSINVSDIGNECAFNANRGLKTNNCFININLEGNNYLHSGSCAPGLGFAKGTPNINGETTGSTLTIQGDGYLEVIGGAYAAGIGSGYGYQVTSNIAGPANNIIINSGNIVAKPGNNGCAIGGAHSNEANNIIINGGNVQAIASNRFGIGASGDKRCS